MKTISPTQKFETPLAAYHAARKSLADSQSMAENKSARFKELATRGDLNDRAVITELVELQMFASLFPTRIPALEQVVVDTDRAAMDAVNAFIRSDLGPRSRALAEKTRASVAKTLRTLIPAGQSLDLAVNQSSPVQQIEYLSVAITDAPLGGVDGHASRVMSAWNRLLELETQQA